jgi:hypothetical protein
MAAENRPGVAMDEDRPARPANNFAAEDGRPALRLT